MNMKQSQSYLPPSTLYRPTFSTYMKANPHSKIRAVYIRDHQRRLAELGDRPYFRHVYPELPPHYPGTWRVYSWPDIEAVVNRLYSIPRHWEIPTLSLPYGHSRKSAVSPTSSEHSQSRHGRISADFRPESYVSFRSSEGSRSSLVTSTTGGQRPKSNQRTRLCHTAREGRSWRQDAADDSANTSSVYDDDDTVSVTSKTLALLQTISSTDGKTEPVFSQWHKHRLASGNSRRHTEGSIEGSRRIASGGSERDKT